MEIADALYGVSMRGDGVTTVIGQRLRDTDDGHEPEPAAGGEVALDVTDAALPA
jgi:chromosome segregation protein